MRRVALLGAAGAALGLAAVHVAWALGWRWGYSACGFRSVTSREAATGCGADVVASVGLVDGWLFAAGWLLVAAVAAWGAVGPRVDRHARLAALGVAVVLLLVSFPLHLLFEVPVGLAGEPTDWRRIGFRIVAVVVAGALLLGAQLAGGGRPRCRHGRLATDRPLSGLGRRAVAVAVAVPLVAWVGPHLAWMSGIPLGIPAETLAEGRAIPLAALVAITFGPAIGALLTAGLARPWGRRLPGWVPRLRGRLVPRGPVLVAGGVVALLLAGYGVMGCVMMTHDLAVGETSWSELADSWAVVATELAFVVWGVALGVGVREHARATRCPACARGRDRSPSNGRREDVPAGRTLEA